MVTEHDRKVDAALAQIPPKASVSAQTALVPHLSRRKEVYLFPFQMKEADVIALDTRGHLYPERLPDYEVLVQELLANPERRLVTDIDGYYVFQDTDTRVSNALQYRLGDRIRLLDYELASQDAHDAYGCCRNSCTARPGQALRLTLYWRSLGPEDIDYSVFVQLLSSSGQMIGQHDGWPGDGLRLTELRHQSDFKRTSQWARGEVHRDVHYLQVSADAPAGQAQLHVGMYDLKSGRRLRVRASDGTRLPDDSIPITEIGIVVPG
jgi:hypothetical protein